MSLTAMLSQSTDLAYINQFSVDLEVVRFIVIHMQWTVDVDMKVHSAAPITKIMAVRLIVMLMR